MLMTRPPLAAKGEIFGIFDAMRIKHPHHEAAVETFETLRLRKKRYPYAQQSAACLFAGSRSGKTTTVKWYIEKVLVPEWLESQPHHPEVDVEVLARLQTIGLYVELSGETTMSGLMSDILEALGDPDPHSGTVRKRQFRVEKALAKRGYQIIFLDETQHLKMQTSAGPISRQEDATSVQNTLKNWVKRWPIVFVGTQHAERVVFEHQVQTRSEPPIRFGPLHYGREEDQRILEDFCGRLALKIVQHNILTERPELLVKGDVPLCLNIASKGRLGLIAVIVRMALEYMAGSRLRELRREHLEKAVESYSLRIGLCSYNPFTHGPHHIPSIEEFANDDSVEPI